MPGSFILFGVVVYLLFFTFMVLFLGRAVLAEHRQQVAREAEARWQVTTAKKESAYQSSRERSVTAP